MTSNTGFERLIQAAQSGTLSRREAIRQGVALGLGAPAIAALLAACGGNSAPATTAATSAATSATTATRASSTGGTGSASPASGSSASPSARGAASPTAVAGTQVDYSKGVKGGILKVAANADPATLDLQTTTIGIVMSVAANIFEGLFSLDNKYQPIPELAESHDVSGDGLTHTIKIRKGVPFHNGDEMKSADVVASVMRWGGLSGVGKTVMAATDSLTATDDYTIQFKLKQQFGTLQLALSHNAQKCVIYPKSVIDKAGPNPASDFIGTGPYKLVAHQPDRLVQLARFDQYAALPGTATGYGGHKYAFADEIHFVPVTNEASRIAGMQSGDYHIALEIGNDSYDLLKSDPNLRVDLLQPTNWEFIYLNWKSPLTSQLKIRQAVQAAVNPAPMLAAGRGDQKFWELDPAFMLKSTAWWTDAGKELYNQNNIAKAKQLLQDAKYDGTPLRVLCTQEYPWSYSMAVVMKQQLEQAGFKIDLAVSDWATVVDRRQKPDQWESFITNHGWVPDPTQLDFVGKMNSYPGWYNSEETMKLAGQLASESDFDKRFSIWKQIQTNIYNEIPGVKTGNSSNISVWSKKLGGFTPQQERGIPYWNVWLTK